MRSPARPEPHSSRRCWLALSRHYPCSSAGSSAVREQTHSGYPSMRPSAGRADPGKRCGLLEKQHIDSEPDWHRCGVTGVLHSSDNVFLCNIISFLESTKTCLVVQSVATATGVFRLSFALPGSHRTLVEAHFPNRRNRH